MILNLTGVTKASKSGQFPALRSVLALISTARQRRHLARLDDHLLRDIGLSRAEAAAEASRPIWDAPAHWQRGGAGRG
jgi:uncharacterized protein YjiS (DUF1127 family)